MSLSNVLYAQDELCTDGILLFREDFGGNDPDDPAVSSQSVPGMSSQYYNSGNSLGSGHYTVRKEGWSNGIQWHRQDDHTYPDDKTRGYLLEVDGIGGAEPFYSTTINGLCAGSKLTFSAYVVNVHYAGQLDYFGGSYVYPRLKFVLKDPTTGSVLAEKPTGDIQPDWRYGTPETWKYARDNALSAEWQLMGMNFTVPEGVESIQMFIYNDVERNGSGNDFALDDIEIHLCLPKPEISGEPEVCENYASNLSAAITNDGTMAEPLEYKWWHSMDSITWTEMSGFNGEILAINIVQKANSGWYKVAVSGDGNIESVNCRATSEPFRLKVNECEPPEPPIEELCMDGILLFREDFGGNDPDDPRVRTTPVSGMSYTQATTDVLGSMGGGKYLVTKQGYCNGNGTSQWHLQDDHTYFGDLARGYLLEIDGLGDNAAFYATTIDGLCEGSHLTFSAYVANVMTWGMYIGRPGTYAYPRLKFVLADPATDAELAMYDTGDIPFDSSFIGDNMCWQQSVEWRLVGMNFTVPAGQNSIKLTIYNNATGSNGNDFAIDDIEIRLCAPPVTIEGEAEVCANSPITLTANFSNDGTFAEPLAYKWWHSTDSITWTEMSGFNGEILAINTVQKADSGWYKVAVSGDGNIESVNCRAISEPFRLKVNECEPPEPPIEELCMDGILLFREDFGGNDPDDPRVRTTPVSGMSYAQVTNDVFRSMGSGKYIVTKSGYCNGDTTGWSLPGADQSTYRSQWYIQDDHTHPNDYSRGYFMEIDGSGGNQQFYQTEISGLCEGIELTFSAYVANVFTWFQYDWYTRNRGPVIAPCLKFVLTNSQTGETLVEKNTQQIPFAEELAAKTDWQYSSPWYLVGMNFIVPSGVHAIRLAIYNNVTNGNGNDFALDDIEIHLCMTPDTIRTDTTVCDTLSRITWHGKEFAITDTLRDTLRSYCAFDSIYYELHVERALCEKPDTKTDCYDPAQELHGFSVSADMKVVFAPGNMQYNAAMGQHLCADGTMQQGTWRFAENQWDYIGSHASASSTYNGWIDLFAWGTSGWSDGVEEYQPWSSTTGFSNCYYINGDASLSMTGDYENADWAVYNSIGEYSPNSWRTLSAEEWEFILNGRTNASILCGKATINNVCGLIFLPDDYPFADLSLPQFIPGNDRFCSTNKYTESQWEQLENKGAVFLPAAGVRYRGNNNYPNIHGYYWSVSAENKQSNKQSRAYNLEFYSDVNYPSTQITPEDRRGGRSVRPVMDIPKDYVPTVKMDTTVCDTLLPITWRGHKWEASGVIIDTLQSVCGTDSISRTLNLQTEKCCRDLITIVSDTTVCDTLLPFTWRGMEFAETGEKRIIEKNSRECDSIEYIYALSTYTCEKLWPIIVNKYNWQLLCDNVALRNFFPEQMATAFQWYKNGQAILGATFDDYSEQNELQGVFQLNVHMNDGRSIWSNIIDIESAVEAPMRIHIYNSQGMPVSKGQMTRGVYLYRYEKGEQIWTEKKIVL